MEYYIWVCAIVFVAGLIKGLSGFAVGLVAVPLLVIFMDIRLVVPLSMMFAVVGSLFLIFQLMRQMQWKDLYAVMIGFAPGAAIGVFLLKAFDRDILQLILGTVLVSYSLYSLFFRIATLKIGKVWAFAVGFSSGFLNGTIGAGGPPVIIYSALQPWSKDKTKVTIQGFAMISSLMTVIAQAFAGLVTWNLLKVFFLSLPIFVLGTYIGSRFYGAINEQSYKRIIFSLLAVVGAYIICKTL